MKIFKRTLLILFLLIILIYVTNINSIPNYIILFKGEPLELSNIFGISINENKEEYKIITTGANINNSDSMKTIMDVKLFNLINVKDIEVNTIPKTKVIPLGNCVGLKLYTSGVLVVGKTEIQGKKPYQNSGIEEGDMIIEINEAEITSTEELIQSVNKSNGENINIKYIRNGKEYISTMAPIKTEENEYKLGLWVRDGAAGIGTISYYEPSTKKYAALGHGIIDIDTEKLINISNGDLITAKVLEITKGKEGTPGEIKGSIINRENIRKCWNKYRIWNIWKFK